MRLSARSIICFMVPSGGLVVGLNWHSLVVLSVYYASLLDLPIWAISWLFTFFSSQYEILTIFHPWFVFALNLVKYAHSFLLASLSFLCSYFLCYINLVLLSPMSFSSHLLLL
ncbi:hypothetical protein L873DRAFT_826768 [Choiromyces venosus 120613-1]|uniref:Uncharacterized protein n=1 Tax=Choiromyces venosus 120613-1 TaxID=1336337 RepID=A0A3N4ITX6_9PEZI|nr:hypothetical protein L873DRAFT_826768 [Choiromyces venosus 120613-1]